MKFSLTGLIAVLILENWFCLKPLAADVIATATKENLTEFVEGLNITGLESTIKSMKNVTIFVPSNAVLKYYIDRLRNSNPSLLKRILNKHIVSNRIIKLNAVPKNSTKTILSTNAGENINLVIIESNFSIDGNRVTKQNIDITDGCLHVIDQVLLPTLTIQEKMLLHQKLGLFNSLLRIVEQNGTLILSNISTIFVPIDNAFSEIGPKFFETLEASNRSEILNFLLSHIVKSNRALSREEIMASNSLEMKNNGEVRIYKTAEKLSIDNAEVSKDFIQSTDGIIHMINKILEPTLNIVKRASIDERIRLFGSLYNLAKERHMINFTGQITIFVPTDEALLKMNFTIEQIGFLNQSFTKLQNIFLSHIVESNGVLRSDELLKREKIKMKNNGELKITKNGTRTFIGDAEILDTNIQVAEGMIHIVNAVLDPTATAAGNQLKTFFNGNFIAIVFSLILIVKLF